MKNYKNLICVLMLAFIFAACTKSEFLAKKPVSSIVTPKTLADFQHLLDNTIYRGTGALAQLSDDDYFVQNDVSLSQWTATEKNAYIWAKDLYEGASEIADWNIPYKNIFYSNCVLDGLAQSDSALTAQGQYLKGWALFNRAYYFYDLTRNFCKAYDPSTATSDLGIPLRLTSGIDKIEQRASLGATFDQIFKDLNEAEKLLPATRPSANLNRPSKIAVYALLARICLDMRNYADAETYADKCLQLYNKLIDYNSLNQTASRPFSTSNDELLYSTNTISGYELTATYQFSPSRIAKDLIESYAENDLRKTIYFRLSPADGNYTKKAGYSGSGSYPFTGLATDEVYLIKAECLARSGETNSAMTCLNQLLIKRFANAVPFNPIKANSSVQALNIVLMERRKELVFRAIRWHDLKRLNKEGAAINLHRRVNNTDYTLPSNDSRWVFPIPSDEIVLSSIPQNPR